MLWRIVLCIVTVVLNSSCAVDELNRMKQAEAAYQQCVADYPADPDHCDKFKAEASRAAEDYERAADHDRDVACPHDWGTCSRDRGPAPASEPDS